MKTIIECKAIFIIFTGLLLTSFNVSIAMAKPVTNDPNTFLTMLERFEPESATTATKYYAAVDPTGNKNTYAKWLFEAGFIDNLADFTNTGVFILNEESAVTHLNATDLNFVRKVHTRCVPDCDAPNPDIYSTIENYPTFADAAVRTNRLASVTMEWTAAADGSDPSNKFVTFYAFTGDTNLREPGGIPFAPDLDGRGPKQVPGLCNTCHGGEPKKLNADGSYPNNGNTEARFMSLDLDNFLYEDGTALGPTQAEQEAEYKRTNEIVLITHLSTEKFDEIAGIFRVAAGQEMLEGWYGGPGLPNATFDNTFTPPGWLPPAAPADAADLYHDSVVPACRNCHVQQELSLDFGTYSGFMEFQDAIKELVLSIECGIDNDKNGKDSRAVMPLAKVTYEKFWNNDQDNLIKEHVGTVDCDDL